jgi:hypothetical protein
MKSILFHIKTTHDINNHLQNDKTVRECMDMLSDKYPGKIEGYQWERVDTGINLLIWGNIGGQDTPTI